MGSPPHRRGKGRDGHPGQPPPGITPAWAGKSSGCRYALTSEWDHPRVGGEKDCKKKLTHSLTGSPPRGRGKGGTDRSGDLRHGFTPAWAGKRPWMPSDSSSSRDHPRMGGEKKSSRCCTSIGLGSPPRGRGKVPGSASGHPAPRITPAWAGKSLFCFTAAVPIQDHPRVGGEKIIWASVSIAALESPPHGRGKV